MPSRSEVRRRSSDRRGGKGTVTRTAKSAAESSAPSARSPARARALAFGALCTVCLLVAIGYVGMAVVRTRPATTTAAPGARALAPAAPQLLFVRTDGGLWEGAARLPLATTDAAPEVLGVQCQRVHFAAGQGLCLRDDPLRGGAFLLDADLNVRHRLPSNGITSRARVSPDGKLASMTVFVKGHSYNDGNFSTETTLIDTVSGTSIGNLESFTVLRDGAPIKREDFNFWGVTFARDGNRFYATLGTGGQTFLVEGDLASRQMRTLRENVECPSLSPDNSRLVFKKRVDGGRGPGAVWQLHVLDLTTMTERPIGETRNIDDQVEWLDDNQILYSLRDEGPPATIRPDIWSVSVDGGAPSRLVTGGLSPAVVR